MKPIRAMGRAIAAMFRGVHLLGQYVICGLFNLRRRLFRRRRADYVVFELSGDLLERAPALPRLYALLPFIPMPLTLEALREALRDVAGDPDVRGVLFLVKGLRLSLAQAQSLASLFRRFHGWSADRHPAGRRQEIVVYLENCNNATYALACAADRIYMPPLGDWTVLGLRTEPIFLADTLRRIGVEADIVKVAPWKTAYDAIGQTELSQAHRDQLDWLLDSWYADLVTAISEGRALGENQVRSFIDRAPCTAEEAAAQQLIDGVAYEDELPGILGDARTDAKLLPYVKARGYLLRRPRRRDRGAIGVISLSGVIVTGKSRQFPGQLPILGGSTTGSATVQQLVRAALDDDRLAGVLLHIDSSGGSSLASDLIWRELSLLARQKPLVAYIGDIGASGGYYIALPAHKIVCQSATLTGSIGVITAKLVTREAYHRLSANRYLLRRGKNADIFADSRPWRGEQRDKIEDHIQYTYRLFKKRVTQARSLPYSTLDEVCSGKVWTGRQALAHGLVDGLGDFTRAVEILCEEAGLPTDGAVSLVDVEVDRPRMPISARALGLEGSMATTGELTAALLALLRRDWSALLGEDRVWLLADGLPMIRGQ